MKIQIVTEGYINIYNSVEEPWFLAREVADIIGMRNTIEMMKMIIDGNKRKFTYDVPESTSVMCAHETRAWFIDERALYEVLTFGTKVVPYNIKRRVAELLREVRKGAVR